MIASCGPAAPDTPTDFRNSATASSTITVTPDTGLLDAPTIPVRYARNRGREEADHRQQNCERRAQQHLSAEHEADRKYHRDAKRDRGRTLAERSVSSRAVATVWVERTMRTLSAIADAMRVRNFHSVKHSAGQHRADAAEIVPARSTVAAQSLRRRPFRQSETR